MTTGAAIGYGAEFAISDDQTITGNFVAAAGVTSINGPNFSQDAIEHSDMDSANKYREFMAGMRDGGEVNIELNWVPSATDVLIAALDAGDHAFRITWHNAVAWVFEGVMTTMNGVAPFDDKLTASVVIKVKGKGTFS